MVSFQELPGHRAQAVVSHLVESLADEVLVSFVFGSIAGGKEAASSDVDLMVIGDVTFGAVVDALGPARNRGSLAHPNEDLLGPEEAMLFINTMRTLLHYVSAKLETDDRSTLEETR